MKFSTACASVLYAAGFSVAAKCNADNCARAVTGTLRAQTASHFADCRSFFACTVTPAAATITTTTTVASPAVINTVTADSYPEKRKKRQVTTAVTNCPSAVPVYASACSGMVRYSSACSCFGASPSATTLPVRTVTVTATAALPPATSTVTVSPAAPALCGNAGLQYAYFSDSQLSRNLDPSIHKTDTPVATGVTDHLHFEWLEGNLYGNSLPTTGFLVEHRGYLFAPETGTYTFSADSVFENLFAWVSPLAYSGWNRDNTQQEAHLDKIILGRSVYTIDLVAGRYFPFRMVTSNEQGTGRWNYSITAPSGYVLIGNNPSSAKYTPYVVQYSCDGTTAPVYPPWGQET